MRYARISVLAYIASSGFVKFELLSNLEYENLKFYHYNNLCAIHCWFFYVQLFWGDSNKCKMNGSDELRLKTSSFLNSVFNIVRQWNLLALVYATLNLHRTITIILYNVSIIQTSFKSAPRPNLNWHYCCLSYVTEEMVHWVPYEFTAICVYLFSYTSLWVCHLSVVIWPLFSIYFLF